MKADRAEVRRRREASLRDIERAQWLTARVVGDEVGIQVDSKTILRTRIRKVLARTLEVEHLRWRFDRGTGLMRGAVGVPPRLVAVLGKGPGMDDLLASYKRGRDGGKGWAIGCVKGIAERLHAAGMYATEVEVLDLVEALKREVTP